MFKKYVFVGVLVMAACSVFARPDPIDTRFFGSVARQLVNEGFEDIGDLESTPHVSTVMRPRIAIIGNDVPKWNPATWALMSTPTWWDVVFQAGAESVGSSFIEDEIANAIAAKPHVIVLVMNTIDTVFDKGRMTKIMRTVDAQGIQLLILPPPYVPTLVNLDTLSYKMVAFTDWVADTALNYPTVRVVNYNRVLAPPGGRYLGYAYANGVRSVNTVNMTRYNTLLAIEASQLLVAELDKLTVGYDRTYLQTEVQPLAAFPEDITVWADLPSWTRSIMYLSKNNPVYKFTKVPHESAQSGTIYFESQASMEPGQSAHVMVHCTLEGVVWGTGTGIGGHAAPPIDIDLLISGEYRDYTIDAFSGDGDVVDNADTSAYPRDMELYFHLDAPPNIESFTDFATVIIYVDGIISGSLVINDMLFEVY